MHPPACHSPPHTRRPPTCFSQEGCPPGCCGHQSLQSLVYPDALHRGPGRMGYGLAAKQTWLRNQGRLTQEGYLNARPGTVGQEQSARPRVGVGGGRCPPGSRPCDDSPRFPKAEDGPLCSHAQRGPRTATEAASLYVLVEPNSTEPLVTPGRTLRGKRSEPSRRTPAYKSAQVLATETGPGNERVSRSRQVRPTDGQTAWPRWTPLPYPVSCVLLGGYYTA